MMDERGAPPTCGACDEFVGCDVEGHEDVGWCLLFDEFYERDETDCWTWEGRRKTTGRQERCVLP